jgi:hypothetical protein
MIYEIAGLKVEMDPQYGRLKRQSEAYKSSGEPLFRLNTCSYGGTSVIDKRTDEDREYIYLSAAFCREIIRHGRFFLHASAVVSDGEAYLFSAPSGVGKSTHTALWLKQFPESYILNDDKPVIYPEKERVTVWGTPFSGKTDLQVNCGVPLKSICFLKRGAENNIRHVDEDSAIALTLNNTYRPSNNEQMILLLDMIGQVVKRVDIFEMTSTGESEAAGMSYKVMKGTRL